MDLDSIIEEIKFEVAGAGVLDLEITDEEIKLAIKKALRELERFWDETTMVTVPFASCIDLTNSALDLKERAIAIVGVYRTDAYGDYGGTGLADPMFAQQWMIFSNGGTMYNLNDYVLNYAAWETLLKIKNTMSTDLSFKEDKHNNKLYINHYLDTPSRITIEYVPKLTNVEQIKDEYWIDVLIRLSTALTKIALGRIRTRFTQGNALWNQDGDKMLEEGLTEYKELRETLRTNSQIIYPLD